MQFRSVLNPNQPVTLAATKAAICHWYDNNDAALDVSATDPEKLKVEQRGNAWEISYSFWSNGKYSVIGHCDEAPL
jgi:hypothetical protein